MYPWIGKACGWSALRLNNLSCISKNCNLGQFTFIKVLPRTKVWQNAHQHYRLFSSCRSQLCAKSAKNGGKAVKSNFSRTQLSEFRRLLKVAYPERWRIAGAVGFLVISSSVSLAVPFCMGKVIDIINTSSKDGTLKAKLNYICSILLVVFVIGGLANFARVYLLQISGQRIITSMREKLFSSIMRQEVAFFDKTKTGEVINRLSSDTVLIGSSVTQNISDGLRSTMQAFGSMGMMLYISPKLTMIALCIVPPIAIMSRLYGRYLRNITKQVQDSLAAATSVAEEKISNIRTVRSFAKEEREMAIYNQSVRDVLKLSYKESLARGIFWGSTGLSGNIVVLSVFYAGGMMTGSSLLTVGDLSAFLLYAAYIGVSISGLTSFYTELMRGLGASSRIWELSDRKPLVPYTGGLQPTGPIKGQIEFKGVNFAYPTRNDTPVLSDFDLVVPMGSVTAVVGGSGSGKSTIGNLLLRFYDPDKGSVVLDDMDIKTIDPTWLRNQIGVVSQEPVLFSCSIADNIRYGASDPSTVTMEMIEDAARQANAYMFVRSFQDHFDTLVGERGVMLSGGQRQRIALARAILKNPRILLLDEATSALDAESEYYVKEALERLMVGRTTITIAHRLSTIKSADQIAVLNNGKIAELGSYDDIMRIQDGIFRRLVERQTITS